MAQRNWKVRAWCYTANNPADNPEEWLAKWHATGYVKYHIFQKEKAETGTEHYQGYLELTVPQRMSALKKIDSGAHFERRWGTAKQAADYCKKKESRIAGPWEQGKSTGQGSRTDIHTAARLAIETQSIKAVAEEHPGTFVKYSRGFEKLVSIMQPERTEPPRVVLYYGAPGTGKTRQAYQLYGDTLYHKTANTKWFDAYTGQKTLLLDDFAGAASKMPLTYTLQLLDRYPMKVEVKGGFVNMIATNIVLTTNIHPRLWYDYSKRECQYKALARRIHSCYWFTDAEKEAIEVTHDSFFNEWFETCIEENVFVNKVQNIEFDFEASTEVSDELDTDSSDDEMEI